MTEPLIPPDFARCQAMIPTGQNAFTLGGGRQMAQCMNAPTFLAKEVKALVGDGQLGSMSLCDECKEVMTKQLAGAIDCISFEPIAPVPTVELFPGVLFRRGQKRPDGNCWEFFVEDDVLLRGACWLPARHAYADDIFLDHMATILDERNILAAAIGKAAIECGITNPDMPLTGPQLLLVLADMVTMLEQGAAIRKMIESPELVFVGMKSGRVAKISLRSAIDLHGEVINGDDAQQLEIARLRAEVDELRPAAARYLALRDCPWPGAMQQVGIVSRDNESVWLHGEEADYKIDALMAPAPAQALVFAPIAAPVRTEDRRHVSEADRRCHEPECCDCDGTGIDFLSGAICSSNHKLPF